MSFVLGVCVLIAVLAGGIAYLLFRNRLWLALTAGSLTFAAILTWFLHPVCVPLSENDIASFSPPIETRTETGMIGQRVFQRQDDTWVQCKVWIARALFF